MWLIIAVQGLHACELRVMHRAHERADAALLRAGAAQFSSFRTFLVWQPAPDGPLGITGWPAK